GPALTNIPRITPQERDVLLDAARSLNRKPKQVVSEPHHEPAGGHRPGDVFNARATWQQVLEPKGWTVVRQKENVLYWRKPGATPPGHHATTDYCGDYFYNFSTSAPPFEGDAAYTKFTAFALLYHDGDFSAASKALAAEGYGELRSPRLWLGQPAEPVNT